MTIEQASQQITKFWARLNNFNGTFTVCEILFFIRRKDSNYIKQLGYPFDSIEEFQTVIRSIYAQINIDNIKIQFFVGEKNNDNNIYLAFTDTLSETEKEIVKNNLHVSLNEKDTNMIQLIVE